MALGAGCATHQPSYRPDDGERLRFEEFIDPGTSLALDLALELRRGMEVWNLEGSMEVDARRLALVTFTPMGTTLFSLTYSGDAFEYRSLPGVSLPIPPESLLLLLEVALWPEEALAPWSLANRVDVRRGAGGERTLTRRGRTLIEVRSEASGFAPGRRRIFAPPFELGLNIRHTEELPAEPHGDPVDP